MRTNFRSALLSDPHLKDAEHALRTCVHCGFCTATCPTYILLGDERDSPRGRIMLMQQMLESGSAPNAETVRHLDRCLSCLGCRSACPSGVDYAALIDQSRIHIERHYTRPLAERLFRNFVLFVLTRPALFATLAVVARRLAPIASRMPGRIGAMSRKAAKRLPNERNSPPPCGEAREFPIRKFAGGGNPQIPPTRNLVRKFRFRLRSSSAAARRLQPHEGEVTKGLNPRPRESSATRRILLLPGCVQRALAPEIDTAVAHVLKRQGDKVERLRDTGCCGALALHLGKAEAAKQHARAIIRGCEASGKSVPTDAILMSASGCAAFIKDYGKLFAGDPEWQPRAERLAGRACDFVELAKPAAEPSAAAQQAPAIAFHPPCSLQHGQRISGLGEALLRAAGFTLAAFPDAHLCCGSAGTYSLLQPELAERLRARKLADIKSTGAAAIVSDNIGCLSHLAGELPVFHIAELLDDVSGDG